MRSVLLSAGALAGTLLATHVGYAHSLSCDKTVNGAQYIEVSTYPVTLHYELTVNNTSTQYGSDVQSASDPLLESMGFSFSPAPPFSLDLGASATDSFDVVLKDQAACLAFAAMDGTADNRIDNVFSTSWESGTAQCTATVVCMPPPPPAGTATRTMGFYKTHEQALSACLEKLPISLDLPTALGVLWGSPAFYADGQKRSDIDKDRVLLSRQLLAAMCNHELFGTEPDPSTLLDDGLHAFWGSDCALMLDLANALDAFNNSGDSEPFPAGFDPGPATPRDASSLAVPLPPTSDQCE